MKEAINVNNLTRRELITILALCTVGFFANSCRRKNDEAWNTPEALRQFATISDWNAGALTLLGGQGYLAYEEFSTGFNVYTIHHVVAAYHSELHFDISIPGTHLRELQIQGFTIDDARIRARYLDGDPCAEFLLSETTQRAILQLGNVTPYLRLYNHPLLTSGAFVASPDYQLFDREGKREWTVSRITSIDANALVTQPVNNEICQGRSGGPHILVEDPELHNSQIIPIRSREGRCIIVGVSEAVQMDYRNEHERYCSNQLAILSRPILPR